MAFVGREKELVFLEELYDSRKTEFLPVYGRRRVGKSELLLHFLETRPGVYFLGKQASAKLQIREFLTVLAEVCRQPLLASIEPAGWKEAFNLLMEHWPHERKILLVLDEFQWICESSPELPSILQECLDRIWKKEGRRVFLILCGSHIGFMERKVLGSKSPLFGRRSGQIFLQPFLFKEARKFHPNLSIHDQARLYFLCGGIPFYLRFFEEETPIAVTIQKQMLQQYGALHAEPDFLMREELRELQRYYIILEAMAEGASSAAEIARRTEVDPRNLPYYQNNLIQLGYISRNYPLESNRKPSSRTMHYVLEDPLLRFWFRFLYPNLSYIRKASPRDSWRNLIAGQLDSFFGHAFERLCREALIDLYIEEGLPAAFEVGQYWDNKVQIDVVGCREDERIDIGECKWGRVTSTPALMKEIESKARAYPNPRNYTVAKHVFTRYPLKGKVAPGVRAHHLESLFEV